MVSINHSIFVSVGESCHYDRFVQARGSLQHLSTFDRSKKLLNNIVTSFLAELQVLLGNLGMGMLQVLGVILKNLKIAAGLTISKALSIILSKVFLGLNFCGQ